MAVSFLEERLVGSVAFFSTFSGETHLFPPPFSNYYVDKNKITLDVFSESLSDSDKTLFGSQVEYAISIGLL